MKKTLNQGEQKISGTKLVLIPTQRKGRNSFKVRVTDAFGTVEEFKSVKECSKMIKLSPQLIYRAIRLGVKTHGCTIERI